MKIRTTNGEVHSALGALSNLMRCKMPLTLALRVGRLIRQLRPDGIEIENARQQLIEQYAARDADGKQVPLLDANQKPFDPPRVLLADPPSYHRAEQELFAGTLDVDVEPLTTAEIELMEGSATPADMLSLGQFLVEANSGGGEKVQAAKPPAGRNGSVRRPARARR